MARTLTGLQRLYFENILLVSLVFHFSDYSNTNIQYHNQPELLKRRIQ